MVYNKIMTTYNVKIKHYNHIFKQTLCIYRNAVDFFIHVVLQEYDSISIISGSNAQQRFVETLTIRTKQHPNPKYCF